MIYFAVPAAQKIEIEVLQEVRPPNVLFSYHYHKNRVLSEFIEEMGYRPESVMIDSGAYSAFTKGKNISLIDYMAYLRKNEGHYDHYISLDAIGNMNVTYMYYQTMKQEGFNDVIPVYHFGSPLRILESYLSDGCDYIAIGNTVPENDKKRVATILEYLIKCYPEVKFHLLGSTSEKITEVEGLYSCDSSTWIMMAVMGKPKEIPGTSKEAKKARAIHNMLTTMGRNPDEHYSLFSGNHYSECGDSSISTA